MSETLIERVRKLANEIERLQAIVKKLDKACDLIETADNRAMAVDGPVSPTGDMLHTDELQTILSAVWSTREAALAVKETNGATD